MYKRQLPASAAVLYGMVEFLELLQAHFAPDETLLFLARVGMLGVCAWAFTDAVTSRARGARVFLALCLLAGCGALVLPGGVRLSIAVSYTHLSSRLIKKHSYRKAVLCADGGEIAVVDPRVDVDKRQVSQQPPL